MGELIKTGESGLATLLHGGGAVSVPKPFAHDIFLFDTYVAGTGHVPGMSELFDRLEVEERLEFFREPHNKFDPQAIVIKTASGVKVGYVPRKDNVVFARLMDAGKLLFGRITAKEMSGAWAKIDIKVFLGE